MKSALAGFLGTFLSRNSDHGGYWLHGQLPFVSPRFEFDLLGTPPEDHTPVGSAWRQAQRRFNEQVAKAGLTLETVRAATLQIQMLPEITNQRHGSQMSDGRLVQFLVSAVVEGGRVFSQQQTIFVAPHDPQKEMRRLSDWGD